MCPEGLPVHNKNHIAMDALLQKPERGMRRGCSVCDSPQSQHSSPHPTVPLHAHPALHPISPLQEVVVVVPPPAGGCHLLIVTQGPANGVTQCSIEAAFPIKGVGLTAGSWGVAGLTGQQGQEHAHRGWDRAWRKSSSLPLQPSHM